MRSRASDIFIAVMGVTGSGKSSFISLLCEERIEIGHDLESCTAAVGVYSCAWDSTTTIYLVDTPGFNDTNRTDTEVLREIAAWLTESYKSDIQLSGIIYLHQISDVRMQGSAKKNLLMFKKLCGGDALRNVVLATTMWDKVTPSDGGRREAQLADTPEFWGWMMSKGSRVFRHTNNSESARRIVGFLVPKSKITLDLQEQMVNEHKTLDKTHAGIELESEIAKEREKFTRELREAQDQMKEAIKQKDAETIQAIRELQEENAREMERLDRNAQNLKVSMEKLHQDKYAALELKLKAQEDALLAERELQKNKEKLHQENYERLEK